MEQLDLYAILGVPATASSADIVAAHRKLARQLHPDRNSSPDAERRMQLVNRARDVLADPLTRLQYDAEKALAEYESMSKHERRAMREARAASFREGAHDRMHRRVRQGDPPPEPPRRAAPASGPDATEPSQGRIRGMKGRATRSDPPVSRPAQPRKPRSPEPDPLAAQGPRVRLKATRTGGTRSKTRSGRVRLDSDQKD